MSNLAVVWLSRFGYGHAFEWFERFQFSVRTVPLGRWVFWFFSTVLTESYCSGSSCGS